MKRIILVAAAVIVATGCSMKEDLTTVTTDDGKDTSFVIRDSIFDTTDSLGNKITDTMQVIDTVITDTTSSDKGVVVVSNRTDSVTFNNVGEIGTITGIDTIAANDIRDEIAKENMSLDLFAVTNLQLKGLPQFADFANTYKDQRVVATISTGLPGQPQEVAITTPSENSFYPVLTFGEVMAGIELNNGLYTKGNGVKSFESKLKNLAVNDIVFTVEIKFLDGTVIVPDNFRMQFTIEGTSKKKI